MPTLTVMLQNIRDNIVDVPSATEGRLIGWVNEAQRVSETYGWTGLTSLQQKLTTVGNRVLDDTQSDWQEWTGDPYYLTGAGRQIPMEWLADDFDATSQYTTSTAADDRGRPKALLMTAPNTDTDAPLNIHVYPAADQSNDIGTFSALGDYLIIMPMRKKSPILTLANQTNFFSDHPDLALHLEDYATAKAMLFNRDIENAGIYLQTAGAHFLRAKRADKRLRLQSLKLTPRRDVHAIRRQQRSS